MLVVLSLQTDVNCDRPYPENQDTPSGQQPGYVTFESTIVANYLF